MAWFEVLAVKAAASLARIAWHESGHALVAGRCGGSVGTISIQPRNHFDGFANVDAPVAPNLQVDLGQPLPAWENHAARRELEVGVMVSLAGPLSEPFVPFADDWRLAPHVEAAAAAGLAAIEAAAGTGTLRPGLEDLPIAERDRLPAFDRPIPTDKETVADLLHLLVGSSTRRVDGLGAHLIAETLYVLETWSGDLERLALELLRCETLPAARVVELLHLNIARPAAARSVSAPQPRHERTARL